MSSLFGKIHCNYFIFKTLGISVLNLPKLVILKTGKVKKAAAI